MRAAASFCSNNTLALGHNTVSISVSRTFFLGWLFPQKKETPTGLFFYRSCEYFLKLEIHLDVQVVLVITEPVSGTL